MWCLGSLVRSILVESFVCLFVFRVNYIFIYLFSVNARNSCCLVYKKISGKIIRSCCFRCPFSSPTLVEREITLTNLHFLLNVLLAARNYVETTETSYSRGKISSVLICLALSSILVVPTFCCLLFIRRSFKLGKIPRVVRGRDLSVMILQWLSWTFNGPQVQFYPLDFSHFVSVFLKRGRGLCFNNKNSSQFVHMQWLSQSLEVFPPLISVVPKT